MRPHHRKKIGIASTITSTGIIIIMAITAVMLTMPAENSIPTTEGNGFVKGYSTYNPASIYYGAFTNSNKGPAPVSMSQFQRDAGKNVAVYHTGYYNFAAAFPTSDLNTARANGSIPMLTWQPTGSGGGSQYSLTNITNGNFDSEITAWAQGAKAWGHPFFLRFAHEMNGTWYTWDESQSYNAKGQFIPMWIHVHNIFAQVGATNVTWVWCPYSGSGLKEYYPGDAYVDWTCIDGYNKYTGSNQWVSFNSIISIPYANILSFTQKPMMIGEFSSSEDPSDNTKKATWFTKAYATDLPTSFPKITAVLLFNSDSPQGNSYDYRIESSSNAQTAFAQAVASSYYASNTFGSVECITGYCPIPANPLSGSGGTQTPTPTASGTQTPTGTQTPIDPTSSMTPSQSGTPTPTHGQTQTPTPTNNGGSGTPSPTMRSGGSGTPSPTDPGSVVQLLDNNGKPIQNAVVTYKSGNIIGLALTNANGDITIPGNANLSNVLVDGKNVPLHINLNGNGLQLKINPKTGAVLSIQPNFNWIPVVIIILITSGILVGGAVVIYMLAENKKIALKNPFFGNRLPG